MACNICLSHEVCLLAHEGFWVCTQVHRSYASLEPSLQMEAPLANTRLLKRWQQVLKWSIPQLTSFESFWNYDKTRKGFFLSDGGLRELNVWVNRNMRLKRTSKGDDRRMPTHEDHIRAWLQSQPWMNSQLLPHTLSALKRNWSCVECDATLSDLCFSWKPASNQENKIHMAGVPEQIWVVFCF